MEKKKRDIYSIAGWIEVSEEDLRTSDFIKKALHNFLKSLNATQSPHRSTKKIIADTNGNLIYNHSIAYSFSGTYWQCQCFRTALSSFCSIYSLPLDGRGMDIVFWKKE